MAKRRLLLLLSTGRNQILSENGKKFEPQHFEQADFDYVQEGLGLVCPNCNRPTQSFVLKRFNKKDRITRRRQCVLCGYRWNTTETTQL